MPAQLPRGAVTSRHHVAARAPFGAGALDPLRIGT
jgi:hypothetical protein